MPLFMSKPKLTTFNIQIHFQMPAINIIYAILQAWSEKSVTK